MYGVVTSVVDCRTETELVARRCLGLRLESPIEFGLGLEKALSEPMAPRVCFCGLSALASAKAEFKGKAEGLQK